MGIISDLDPYVGPRPFEREDAATFFGRDIESRKLASLVLAHQVVVLYAASGSGKTSLLNAGLQPILEQQQFELHSVARVAAADEPEPSDLAENPYWAAARTYWITKRDAVGLLDEGVQAFHTYLQGIKHLSTPDGLLRPRAVIFDHFEDLFIAYPHRWAERAPFLRDLASATRADPLLRLVLALREEHLAELQTYSSLFQDGLRHRFRLEPLRPGAALLAITRPLDSTNRRFADGVAERLVNDLRRLRFDRGERGMISVLGEFVDPVQLQVVCLRLWTELPPDVEEINEEHLEEFGNVDEALGRYFNAAIEAAAEKLFMRERRLRRRLESVFITSGGTRGTAYRGADSTGGIPNAVIEELAAWHILRVESRSGGLWYELTHDRLIEAIQASNRTLEARRARWLRGAVALLVISGILTGVLIPLLSSDATRSARRAVCTGCTASILDWRATAKHRLAVGHFVVEISGPRPGVFPVAWQIVRATDTTTPLVTQRRPFRLLRAGARFLHGRIPMTLPSGGGSFAVVLAIYRPGAGPGASPLDLSSAPVQVPRTRARLARLVVKASKGGRVTSFPAGIRCPRRCGAHFTVGRQVVLRARPKQGWFFVGWRGDCHGNAICSVTLAGPTKLRATFRHRR